MVNAPIGVRDLNDSSIDNVRTYQRNVGGTPQVMEAVIALKAGIPGMWTLYGQAAPAPALTLPYSAKMTEAGSSASSCTQHLLRRPFPVDLANATSFLSGTVSTTSDNTVTINGARFFLAEKTMEDITLDNLVYAKTNIGILTANTAATAYLQRVDFALKRLTGADTYDTICSASITGINYSNATTSVTNKSVAALMKPATAYVLPAGSSLVLEISTYGKTTNTSYAATHRLYCSPSVSDTFVDLYVEEA